MLSIISADLLGTELHFNWIKRSWFVICDWWISIVFCASEFQSLLLVIVIMIDGSEKRNCEGV